MLGYDTDPQASPVCYLSQTLQVLACGRSDFFQGVIVAQHSVLGPTQAMVGEQVNLLHPRQVSHKTEQSIHVMGIVIETRYDGTAHCQRDPEVSYPSSVLQDRSVGDADKLAMHHGVYVFEVVED